MLKDRQRRTETDGGQRRRETETERDLAIDSSLLRLSGAMHMLSRWLCGWHAGGFAVVKAMTFLCLDGDSCSLCQQKNVYKFDWLKWFGLGSAELLF